MNGQVKRDWMKFMFLITFMLTAHAQNDSSSGRCIFFPHSDLFCGQYIDASTMVHVDPNVFNYTEANNRLQEFSVNGVNGAGLCRPIREYTFCLSIYPHCNGTTQALVPPCLEDCMEYSDLCDLSRFFVFTTIPNQDQDSLDAMFLLPCSNPYRAFSSVIVDTENCFNFSFPPIFVVSSNFTIINSFDTRLLVLSDRNFSTEYCSEFQNKDISVACRAIGIPMPQIDIFVNGVIIEPFQQEGSEAVIRLPPISFGEVVMFECQASTLTATANITIDLTYTCCFDDLRTQYSFGQQFMTRDCSECLCGNGGNISCTQLQCESNGISTGIIVAIAVGIFLVIAVVFFMIFICSCCALKKKKHRKPNNSPANDQTVNHGIKTDSHTADHEIREDNGRYISYLTLMTSSEEANFKLTLEIINNTFSKHQLQDFIISNDSLKICELLGAGSFGQVFYGLFTSNNDERVMEVAIKTIKECHSVDDLDLFIAESVIMKDFKHKNILGLVGVYTRIEDEIAKPYIVLPFMVNKDLKNFLLSKRKEVGNDLEALLTVINYSTLVKMCFDICCGMEYLSSIKYVHRDLAARNCMVDKDLTIKVADFGLTRDIYCDDYYRMGHKSKVPIKWMPPESILDKYYNQKTDVWSFGIVCWEVFSLGKQPYPGVESQNILQHIESGNRLHKTALCKNEMYQIMLSCWQLKNNDRPTFSILVEQLEQHYSDTFDPYLQLIS